MAPVLTSVLAVKAEIILCIKRHKNKGVPRVGKGQKDTASVGESEIKKKIEIHRCQDHKLMVNGHEYNHMVDVLDQ